MEVWVLCAVVLLLSPTFRAIDRDTVEEQVESIVMQLTPAECEDLVEELTRSEDEIIRGVEALSPERNLLYYDPCRDALKAWLAKYGAELFIERLTSCLQRIGRTDVALEVEKEINQDILLNLQRYVDEYSKIVKTFNVPQTKKKSKFRAKKVRDLSSKDYEVRVRRGPVSPYSKGPMEVLIPILYGLALGFWGTLLVVLGIYQTKNYLSRRRQRQRNIG